MRNSDTHPLRINDIAIPGVSGRIGITFCPGKKGESFTGPDWDRSMDIDLDCIVQWGASRVITLIEDFEFDMLQVRGLGEEVERKGMRWHHLPIVDGQPPDERFNAAWLQLRGDLVGDLKSGHRLLVHCRGGLGRAGTVASLLLIELGLSAGHAIEQVRSARPGAIETFEQELYIEAYRQLQQ